MYQLSNGQRICVGFLAAGFVIGGAMHFITPEFYNRIMPPWIPWHSQLVAISGVFEILGGVGLLIPSVRRVAAWGLVALLVAVFPANIYEATNPAEAGVASLPHFYHWVRLPGQFGLMWLVLWCTRVRAPR